MSQRALVFAIDRGRCCWTRARFKALACACIVLLMAPKALCLRTRRLPRREHCVDLPQLRPSYVNNAPLKTSAGTKAKKAINILVMDSHLGMQEELNNVAKKYAASRPDLNVRVLSVSFNERTCETRGYDAFGMCLSDDQARFARLTSKLEWLSNADIVMFSMPPPFLQQLLPLKKAFVMWLAVPPEYGRQNSALYAKWLADFRRAALLKHAAIVAASEYDRMYVKYFYNVDLDVVSMPSDHLSHSKPNRRAPPMLGLFPKATWSLDWVAKEMAPALEAVSKIFNVDIDIVDPAANNGAMSDLHRFQALIYMPYMRNTNLFIEAYRSNIPIFTPSLDYLVRLDQAHCMLANRVYWTRIPEPCSPPYPYSPATLEYDMFPAVSHPKTHTFWLNLSQQFASDMPGVIYFDSPADLVAKLTEADFETVKSTMEHQNAVSRKHIHSRWRDILDRVAAAIPCSSKESSGGLCQTGRTPYVLTNSRCNDDEVNELHSGYLANVRARQCGVDIDYEHWPKRLSCEGWGEDAIG